MMKRVSGVAIAIVCGLAAMPASAQSLADVARQEEARRKNPAAKKAVKSFSNADLAPSEIAPPTPVVAAVKEAPAQAGDAAAPPANASADAAPAAAPAKAKTSEADIRERAGRIRERLLKAQQDLDPIRNTANDGSRSPGERAVAARMVQQGDKVLESIERQWRALEKQVEEEELPREWLDPRPILSTRIPQ